MKRILIALDGSKGSESILPYIEAILKRVDADVTVATVTPEGTLRQKNEARAYLKDVGARLAQSGAYVDGQVLTGNPALKLIRHAREGGFDLLAMCSREKSGLKRMVLGSVAEDVLRHTSVPVLVVHPREDGAPEVALRRIAVPLDGSHRSGAILRPVAKLAKAFGAMVDFVSVVSSTKRETLPVATVAHNIFQEQQKLRAFGVPVELSILYGDPATGILDFARKNQSDLLAIATHGRTGLKRAVYGSVAEKVLRKSEFPLLVVRSVAVMRQHPVHRLAGAARRRSLETMRSAGDLMRSPYSGSAHNESIRWVS